MIQANVILPTGTGGIELDAEHARLTATSAIWRELTTAMLDSVQHVIQMMESNAPRALHIASIASHLAHLVATHVKMAISLIRRSYA